VGTSRGEIKKVPVFSLSGYPHPCQPQSWTPPKSISRASNPTRATPTHKVTRYTSPNTSWLNLLLQKTSFVYIQWLHQQALHMLHNAGCSHMQRSCMQRPHRRPGNATKNCWMKILPSPLLQRIHPSGSRGQVDSGLRIHGSLLRLFLLSSKRRVTSEYQIQCSRPVMSIPSLARLSIFGSPFLNV
jgi:hypothetical protein